MKLKNSDYNTFLKDIENKKIICFGTGKMLKEMEEEFSGTNLTKQIYKLTDNNSALWYNKKVVFGEEVEILPPHEITNILDEDYVILIANNYYMEIIEQLEGKINVNVICYIFPFLRSLNEDKKALNALKEEDFLGNKSLKIPKKIHYCWFGNSKLPEYARYSISSWEKYCPDYEIIKWDEKNYDISKNKYMKQAYDSKRWGFVPDYARLDIIHKHGGIYLDTDVEVIKNLDNLLYNDAFAGFESIKHVAFGLGFGAAPGFLLFKEMMEEYGKMEFYNEDGSLNLIASPVHQTKVLKKYGLKQNGNMQYVKGMRIYPVEYFSPLSPKTGILYKTENTYSIHHFAASWQENKFVEARGKKLKLLRKLSGYNE